MAKFCLKRKISLCAVVFLLITGLNSHAQIVNAPIGTTPWKYSTPYQYGFVLNDMSFIDNNIGLGVGNNGAIARTTDGGNNWQFTFYKYASTTNQVTLASLNDVHFVTPTVAYAVGLSGVMIKSTDGGVNWTQINTPLTALARNINALHFLNKDTGYIGGAAILTSNTIDINCAPKVYVTRNGGATWDSLATPFVRQFTNATLNWNNQKEIQRIHFANDSVGYVSGSGGSDFTGGQSALLWKIKKNIVTDYCLHRTKFGLTTGNHQPSVQTYKGVIAVNDSTALMSSLNNNVVVRVKTGENDSTASALPATYGNYVEGSYEVVIWLNSTATPFPASLVGTVAGQMHHFKKMPGGNIILSAGRNIVSTPDNGTTWAVAPAPPVPNSWWSLFAMDVTPNSRIIAGGSSGILYDSLPGSPWRTQWRTARPLKASNGGAPFDYIALDFADCDNGVLVGSNGTITKTSDGGNTWVDNSNPVFEAAQLSLTNVKYHAVNSMFFSAGNSIYKSADQGTTNDVIFTEPVANSQLVSFDMVGLDKIFAISYRFSPAVQRTLILRSLNANSASPTWDTVKTFPTGTLAPQLRSIKFANQDTGYTCGSRGKVYRTVDGGATWTDISPDTTVNGNGTANYSALSVVNGKTVFVAGNGRRLFRSTDAGVTWTDLILAVTAPTTLSNFTAPTSIVMNDANNGYLASGAFLLKTTDGWATWTYDMAPLSLQNMMLYPKIPGPIQNKKLLSTVQQASTFANSQISATILEYGNAAFFTLSSTETATNASCTNTTSGTITVNAAGAIAPYTYSIDGVNFQTSNTFTGLTQGPKTVTVRESGCGRTIVKTVNVGFTDNLTLTASNDTLVCSGAPVPMLATANSATATYSWAPAGGLSANNISNPVATVTAPTTYTVTATLNGCVRTEPVSITIKPNPIINAGPDKTIVEGDETQLTGSGISNPVSIAWAPAGSILSGANSYTATAKPLVTTDYTLTVRNTDNCTSTDVATVTVIPYCVNVMNAFTPNGDGNNDRWMVTNGAPCSKDIQVAIYNRYGNVIYTSNNYANDWDGTFKGKPVADGTYYYTVTYHTITGKRVTKKGDVTILR
ncbi:MAG TPA: YCF48-related protein [Chitinophagaceae bacterium]